MLLAINNNTTSTIISQQILNIKLLLVGKKGYISDKPILLPKKYKYDTSITQLRHLKLSVRTS